MEVRLLLIYPPGPGGTAVSTSNYCRLGTGVYMNDALISFYLKYLHRVVLTEEQRHQTYMFSSFFYSRLRWAKSVHGCLPTAKERHDGVARWTKNLKLFDHDFIVFPLNDAEHWFVAIVCNPNLTQAHTMDTNK